MSEIKLKIDENDIAYSGWKEVRVTQSLNNICGAFSFYTSEKYPENPQEWDLHLGKKCSIEIDDQTVLVGYIEDVNIDYDSEGHNIQVMGRDVTCDLVDCTYNGTSREWKKQSLGNIVKAICNSFGITVKIENSVSSICREKVTDGTLTSAEGEMAYELISRICKAKSILPVCYGDGFLTLTRAGTNGFAYDPIQLRYNVLSANAQLSNRERFYKYIVKGTSVGIDEKDLWEIAGVKNNNITDSKNIAAIDSIIKRQNRVFTKIADGNVDIKTCNDLADWEKTTRAGNSRKYIYTLVDWTQSDGNIWKLNSLVNVIDPMFNLKKNLLISDIEYSFSDNSGTTVNLTVVSKSTYNILQQKITEKNSAFDMNESEGQ